MRSTAEAIPMSLPPKQAALLVGPASVLFLLGFGAVYALLPPTRFEETTRPEALAIAVSTAALAIAALLDLGPALDLWVVVPAMAAASVFGYLTTVGGWAATVSGGAATCLAFFGSLATHVWTFSGELFGIAIVWTVTTALFAVVACAVAYTFGVAVAQSVPIDSQG
jgi:hypothetical protein